MNTSQSLDRGLKILDAIDRSMTPVGVREIGRQLGLNAAIVQRLVNTLAANGFVEQVSESRRYRLGYRSWQLGKTSGREDKLPQVAQTYLATLAADPGLNGYLGVLAETRAVYILSVPSLHRIVLRINPGETMSLHATALGKVLLASVEVERAEAILSTGPLSRFTPHTIVDRDAILGQLPTIRKAGYACVHEESILGIASVGAPVRDAKGQIAAAISVAFAIGSYPSLAFDDVIAITTNTARRISREMGCPDAYLEKWAVAA